MCENEWKILILFEIETPKPENSKFSSFLDWNSKKSRKKIFNYKKARLLKNMRFLKVVNRQNYLCTLARVPFSPEKQNRFTRCTQYFFFLFLSTWLKQTNLWNCWIDTQKILQFAALSELQKPCFKFWIAKTTGKKIQSKNNLSLWNLGSYCLLLHTWKLPDSNL